MKRIVAGALALVLVVLVGAYVLLRDGDDALEVVPGLVSEEIEGSISVVRIPIGEVTVTIGEPVRDDLDGDLIEGIEDREPPSGGSFLPISFDFDFFTPIAGGTIMSTRPEELDATLKVDGRTIPLPSVYSVVPRGEAFGIVGPSTANFYVPSTESDPEAVIEFTYDGLTQTLDASTGDVDETAAAPLYADAPVRGTLQDCVPEISTDYPGLEAEVACETRVLRVPYYPGAGWAEEGSTYVVADYRLFMREVQVAGGRNWTPLEVEASASISGSPPLETQSADSSGPSGVIEAIEVFSPVDDRAILDVSATFTVEAPGSERGGVQEVVARAAVNLP